jgi:hypothetical protein
LQEALSSVLIDLGTGARACSLKDTTNRNCNMLAMFNQWVLQPLIQALL